MRPDDSCDHNALESPLLASELFGQLDSQEQQRIEAIKQHIHFNKDTDIMSYGERPSFVCLVRDGKAVSISRSGLYDFCTCAVQSGQLFGLIEMLAGSEIDLTIRALSPCDVDIFRREDLMKLLLENPVVCLHLIQVISSHYQRMVSQLKIS